MNVKEFVLETEKLKSASALNSAVAFWTDEVKQYGNSGRISIPRKYVGMQCTIIIHAHKTKIK